ncbi:MAG: hypothetical protein AABY64_00615 [Bdellovibrionota bacterium]|mgnify:CR=1 FL=1
MKILFSILFGLILTSSSYGFWESAPTYATPEKVVGFFKKAGIQLGEYPWKPTEVMLKEYGEKTGGKRPPDDIILGYMSFAQVGNGNDAIVDQKGRVKHSPVIKAGR